MVGGMMDQRLTFVKYLSGSRGKENKEPCMVSLLGAVQVMIYSYFRPVVTRARFPPHNSTFPA